MTPYLLGLVFFFGLPVRVRFGEAPSLGIYSVVSLIGCIIALHGSGAATVLS